jgi:hypothetical protein
MATLNFDYGVTQNLSNAGVVAGATSTYTTTAATSCVIQGKFTTPLAPQTAQPTPTTDAVTGQPFVPVLPNSTCVLVIGVNAAGAIQMAQGQILPTNTGVTTTVGAFLRDPQFPPLADNFCALAYTVIRTAPSAAPWTPGTGAWAASGVTATAFQNVSQLPSRPQLS